MKRPADVSAAAARGVVARCPSSRDADVVYDVRRGDDGTYTCCCPGFTFRGRCRHVTALAELRALPLARCSRA